MQRIFHNHDKWECLKAGFYDKVNNYDFYQSKVVELFYSPKNTQYYMEKVIKEWKHSCEHNLTNTSINRIAWLGQAACCLYGKVPYYITMATWRYITPDFQLQANKIAELIILDYEKNISNE